MHTAQNPPSVVIRELHALPLGDHREGGASDGPELLVHAGHHRRQPGGQELPEPCLPHGGIAEDALELWVQRPEV